MSGFSCQWAWVCAIGMRLAAMGVWIAQHPGFTQHLVFTQHPVSSEEIWLCREKLIEVDVEDGGVDVVERIDQE